jgi:hypothetical protein
VKIITVISPDKLSMSMFCDFYKTIYIGDDIYKVLDMSCLNTPQTQELIVKDFIEINKDLRNAIIKYKIKPKTKLDVLPKVITEVSQYIIRFDMFSTHPEIVKDFDGSGKEIIDRWLANIAKRDQK